MKYSDRSKFPPIDYQNGIYLNGQVPLDERSVAATINDLYVNPSNRGASTLYGRAYVGMPVTIVETNQILICKNADPYTPGNSATTVNDDNFTTYWQSPLSEILSANAAGTGGGIDVSTLKSELTGQDIYSIGAKVDGTNIKIVNDKITGGSYKLTRVDSHTLEDGIWASYRLSYKGPGASTYTDLTDTQIDIPELDILEEVHICKATYDPATGKYTETATDPADPSWETAAGDVYLHLIWKLSDQDSSKTTETYIKVGDMIKVDLTTINNRIKNLEDASNNVFGPRLNSCDASINALRKQISDTSTDFNTKLQNTSTYFEGLNTARVNDISTLRANTNSSLNDMNTTFTQSIANTKEELSGTISTVQTELNTKIDNNTSTLNSLVSEVSSNLSSFQISTNASIGRIDTNITTIDSSINSLETHMGEIDLTVASLGSLVSELKTRVETAETTVEKIGEDVSTQEQVMAGAIVDMRSDYRTQIETLHDNPNIWAPNGTYGTSATRSAAPSGDEVRGLSYVETETGNRTIDLTALFETEQGQPADVDLRSIYDSALFVAKGPVQVRVDTTFREDTDDSLILYYDFIDATAVKRQVIEIGNNDDAVLTVLMKKTVTLAKFR